LLKSILQKAVREEGIPPENIFYVDKDLFLFDSIITYKDLDQHFQQFLQTAKIDQKIVIAVDEVQEIQQWEKIINSYLATYGQHAEIFITGSNSTMLSSELSTLLTGRYIEIEVFPLDVEEYALFAKKPLTRELFEEYLQYGGLPGILHLQQKEAIYPYLQDIYATILLKDIVKYF
jgi:predicted AAA+ superfamily ATPase